MKKWLEKIEQKKALFFDFDGTLLNSEKYHQKAHSIVLSKILGRKIELTKNDFQRYIGKTDDIIFDMYKKDFDVEFDKEKMIQLKKEIAFNLLKDKRIKIFSYFYDIVKMYPDKKYYILSSQDEILLRGILKDKHIDKYFKNIYCMPTYKMSKKEFLLNLFNLTGYQYNESVMFEDVDSYLELGGKLGMFTVGIENDLNKNCLKNYDVLIKR